MLSRSINSLGPGSLKNFVQPCVLPPPTNPAPPVPKLPELDKDSSSDNSSPADPQ
ncbi:hypothetical protein A2U01_0058058 [Trifolium medium]|uniref:Uncharacterized protein n=1 Tax=Trifolium medium TaxID=97028 RepID=A0A392RMR0_9FABA|nr:hypothetical protein [Trifolium medium]